ncbi:MAG: hypothetical protein Q4F39_07145 [Bacteroidia bacterium]|nr:hypothetical protein [Bacteroidia bacterium]
MDGKLTEETLEQYFSMLERRAEEIVQSEPDSEYNRYFTESFVENASADSSLYISLPYNVMVYVYDMELLPLYFECGAGDLLNHISCFSPKSVTAFVPKIKNGRRAVYIESGVEETLLNFLGMPYDYLKGADDSIYYSNNDVALGPKYTLIRKYIPVNIGPRQSEPTWNLLYPPVLKYLLVGNDGIYVYIAFGPRDDVGYSYFIEFPHEKLMWETEWVSGESPSGFKTTHIEKLVKNEVSGMDDKVTAKTLENYALLPSEVAVYKCDIALIPIFMTFGHDLIHSIPNELLKSESTWNSSSHSGPKYLIIGSDGIYFNFDSEGDCGRGHAYFIEFPQEEYIWSAEPLV